MARPKDRTKPVNCNCGELKKQGFAALPEAEVYCPKCDHWFKPVDKITDEPKEAFKKPGRKKKRG